MSEITKYINASHELYKLVQSGKLVPHVLSAGEVRPLNALIPHSIPIDYVIAYDEVKMNEIHEQYS